MPLDLEGVYENGKVLLSWKDMAGDEDGYLVQFSNDNGESFKKAEMLSQNTTTYASDGNGQMGTVIYRVAAKRGETVSPWSNTVSLELITGHCDNPIPGLDVFPNPAFDEVQLYADAGVRSVYVVDLLGRPVARHGSVSTINLQGLPPSVYFLRIKDEEDRICLYKLIKE